MANNMFYKFIAAIAACLILASCRTTNPPKSNADAVPQPQSHAQAVVLTYIGNPTTRVFHASNCAYLPETGHRTEFTNRVDAVAAGYRPCKFCNP